jgi:hypothetical protein
MLQLRPRALRPRPWFAAGVTALVGALAAACSSSSSGGTAAAPVPPSATAGFDVSKNAFAFPNFAYGYASALMTPDLAVRMFGATAVCADTQSPCTLTPAANLWINNVNASMDGGRCEGFAVLSGVFFLGLSSSSSFGAGSTRDLTLDGNIPLQQELAYWYATQNVSAVTQATKALEAKDAIAFLATFLKSGTPEYYRIGFVRRTATGVAGGHAVLPTGYEEINGQKGVYKLHVYDNNYPDSDRVMTVDTVANRWEYQGSSDPTQASADYVGDAANKNPLYFAPIKVREGTLACPFCTGSATAQTYATGSVSVSESDRSGNSAGYDAQGAPATSGQASVQPGFSDIDTWDNASTTTLVLPAGDSTVKVAGSDATVPSSVLKLGAGYAVQASNLSLPAGASDTLTLGGSGARASYVSTSGTALALSSSIVRSSGGLVQMQVTAPAHATTVAVGLDDPSGTLTAQSDGTAGQMVLVTVLKTAADGTKQSGTLVASGSATSTITVQSTTWMPGQPLTGAQDTGDGTVTMLSDACVDGVEDGNESDVDCGGTCAAKCAQGSACAAAGDCATGACNTMTHVCAATTCSDGSKDGNESDVDCGGTCAAKCAQGSGCAAAGDCATGACNTTTHACVATTCSDGSKDGAESDVDCGGGTCAACPDGKACMVTADCTTLTCTANVCVDAPKVVYVTSTAYPGNFGGLAGADAICALHPEVAAPGAVFKAWLSDSTASPSTRFTHPTGTYVNVDFTEVAKSYADFFSGVHESRIEDEAGNSFTYSVFTATTTAGIADVANGTCQNWTADSEGDFATVGDSSQASSDWSFVGPASCETPRSLYCVQQ